MKKILLIAPDYYGFDQVIYDSFKKHSQHEVTLITSNRGYSYKNVFEKTQNFFSKLLLNKNLKEQKKYQQLTEELSNCDTKSIILVNRPDLLSSQQLQILKGKTNHLVALYWDSFEKIPQQNNLHFFDKGFSFDTSDCVRYNLINNTNFYFVTNDTAQSPIYDLFYLGTYDNRVENLYKIFKSIKRNHPNLRIGARLYSFKDRSVESDLKDNIELTNKLIPFNKAYSFNLNTRIILDLAHNNQNGLSFRPFEALGLHKKLITDNKEIANYDFYNPNNILIIDHNNPIVPDEFLNSDYESLPPSIYEKYSAKSWVNFIIEQTYAE